MRAVLIAAVLMLAACDTNEQVGGIEAPAPQTLAPASLPAFFDCLREHSAAIVSAHRGGPAPGYAENAIPTFEHTLTLAPAIMEVDIARTRDGVLVLMHDDTVDRTTDGEGAVNTFTAAQFAALTLEDDGGHAVNAHPPTLREALDWANGKTVLALDVKRGVSYEDVAREVDTAHAMGRVMFITYSVDGASRLHRVAPEAMQFVTINSAGDLDTLARRGVDLTHVVAWTGTSEPNSELNVALAQRGVEAEFGTLGGRDSWDARFEHEHHDQYAAFAETGVQVIATGRPGEAVHDLDVNDGHTGYDAMQCVSAH
jgi:glycerophosphoryl diester phosphodiesterase